MPAQGNALGHTPPNTSSPEGAKQGGKIPIGDVTETRVEQTGPQAREFTYVDIGSIDRETKRIVDPKVLPSSKAPSRAKQLLKTGDVLVSMTRPNLNAVALVPPDLDGAIGSTGFHVLRARDAEPGFLFYAVQSAEFIDAMCLKVQGALYPAVRPRDISSFCIPPSSLAQQRRIVAEIEKQFTRLEAGVAALRRVRANLKRYRAAVLKAACEGRLVPTEAELRKDEGRRMKDENKRPKSAASSSSFILHNSSFESGSALLARILNERRQNWQGRGQYKEPAAPDTVNLPSLPEGWTWVTVEQLGDVQLGRQRSPKNVSKNYPTKYIRAANITERGIDVSDVLEMEFSPAERERFALRDGDVVLSEASGSPSHVGKPAVWRNELPLCCFQNTVLRLRPIAVQSKYVLVTFQQFHANSVFAKVAGGVGINHLGAEKFSVIPFPLPPLAEQTRIVAEVERRLSVVEELESVVSANLQRAVRLRQSILQKAFTGQLV